MNEMMTQQGGELTNAYNATVVKATGNGGLKGNVAGTNSGTIENVYATNTDGKLIGSSNGGTATNAYTFADGDGSAAVLTSSGQKQGKGQKDAQKNRKKLFHTKPPRWYFCLF